MTKDERARMRAASATWKLSNTYHSRTLALLDALDDKDALIADLLSFIVSGPKPQKVEELAWRTAELAALKARAGE